MSYQRTHWLVDQDSRVAATAFNFIPTETRVYPTEVCVLSPVDGSLWGGGSVLHVSIQVPQLNSDCEI